MTRMSSKQFQQLTEQRTGDPVRRYRGHINREVGAAFEQSIDAACEMYSRTGRAEIEKTPEPMKILERQGSGRFVCCFLKKAQPDYKGTLRGGRAVNFEAKHTTTDRVEFGRLKPEQRQRLERNARIGAACFVIVGFSMQSFHRVPWEVWKKMREHFGHQHATRHDLLPYAIPGDSSMVLFLEGLEEN